MNRDWDLGDPSSATTSRLIHSIPFESIVSSIREFRGGVLSCGRIPRRQNYTVPSGAEIS